MSIRIKCPGCQRTIEGGDDRAGKKALCPNCGKLIHFPTAAKTTIIPPKQLEPPDDWLSGPSFKPAPVIYELPRVDPPPVSTPQATLEHRHKAAGGAFRTGFGVMFGCLTAFLVFTVAGSLALRFLASSVTDADVEALSDVDSQLPNIQQDIERQLDNESARLERQFDDAVGTAQSQSVSGFDYKNVSMRSDFGMLRLIGEATNNSGRNFRFATFVVSLYDKNGKLVDTGNAIISNFANGQTKSFEAPFLGVSAEQVDKYKVEFENGL